MPYEEVIYHTTFKADIRSVLSFGAIRTEDDFFSPKKTDLQSVLCKAQHVDKCIAVCVDGLGAGFCKCTS